MRQRYTLNRTEGKEKVPTGAGTFPFLRDLAARQESGVTLTVVLMTVGFTI